MHGKGTVTCTVDVAVSVTAVTDRAVPVVHIM